MALATKVGHRFQNSLDMVAARSTLIIDLTQPSGTDNAWSMLDSPILDSPTLGRMSSFNKGKAPTRDKPVPAPLSTMPVNVAPLVIKKANVAPLDIKKIRRRGFMTGVQLDLPPTPQPFGLSPLFMPPLSSPPQTALTFTAEWDLTQRAFVFTPFESSYPLSASSPHLTVSPVPDDVASLAETVALSDRDDREAQREIAPASPSSSVTTPCSEIFDDASVYSQDDSIMPASESTTPSSASAVSMSPRGLYCKPEASSSSSLTRQITLNMFEEELHRYIPPESHQSDFDKGCYEEMDEDLLLAPMDVFERMLWASTEADARLSKLLVAGKRSEGSPISLTVDRPSPLPPLGPGLPSGKPYSPVSPDSPDVIAADISLPLTIAIPRHSRNFSFPSPGPRQRPKGPRRKRNFSADIARAPPLKV